MVKADWVKYPMDHSEQEEAFATFVSKGLAYEDVHVCSTFTEQRRRVVDTTESSAVSHSGSSAGVAGVEATPSTKGRV
jgi:hypothetical protein